MSERTPVGEVLDTAMPPVTGSQLTAPARRWAGVFDVLPRGACDRESHGIYREVSDELPHRRIGMEGHRAQQSAAADLDVPDDRDAPALVRTSTDAGVRGECCNCDMGDSAAPRPDPIRIRTLALRASGSVMADHLRHRRELVEHPHRILRVQHGHPSAKSNRLGPRRDSAVHRPAGIRAAHRSRRRQSRGNRLGVSRPSRAQ